MQNDSDFKAKLHLYKTAFCPLYNTYVRIGKVRDLPDGSCILHCTMSSMHGEFLLRPCELTNFVL